MLTIFNLVENGFGVIFERAGATSDFGLRTPHHRGQLLSMITLLGYEQPFEGGDYGGWSNTG